MHFSIDNYQKMIHLVPFWIGFCLWRLTREKAFENSGTQNYSCLLGQRLGKIIISARNFEFNHV